MAFTVEQNQGEYRPMSEINVTPFVDVMLVLLVIFMVTAPMMVQGLDVNLPDVAAAPLENTEAKLLLTVTKDKKILLGSTQVLLERLKDVLTHNAKIKTDKELVLHADKDLSHGFVTEVMALAREGGAEKINIVTDPIEKSHEQ